MGGNRMNLLQQFSVRDWMREHADDIGSMSQDDLASAVHSGCGIELSAGTAARWRKQLGLAAESVKRERVDRLAVMDAKLDTILAAVTKKAR